jgi:surface antigen
MNRFRKLGTVLVLSLGLAACADQYGPKESIGTLVGAGLGGLAGSQIGHGSGKLAATGAGVLLGGLLGNQVGRSLDRADRTYAERTSQQALEYNPSGQSAEWRNPDSGNYGYVTPQRPYQDASGRFCREYQQTIYVGGQAQQGYGTACRQPDGSWQVQGS